MQACMIGKRVELLNRSRPCASSAFCTEGPFRKWLLGLSSINSHAACMGLSLAVSWALPQAWSISGCKPVNQAFTNNHFAAITLDWGFSWKYFSFQRKTICSISTELCGMHERIAIAKLHPLIWSFWSHPSTRPVNVDTLTTTFPNEYLGMSDPA